MSARQVVIVGGGVAGLLLATRLGRQLGRGGQARVSLVDRSLTHVWKPMLHTIAAGTRDVHQQQVNYLAHASENGFFYEPGELTALDRNRRRITLAPIVSDAGETIVAERTLDYDALVLALGSGANDFGTPGVREHCHFIDSQAQAEHFNAALRLAVFRGAIHDEPVRIGIVGAGATGVELAAELSNLLEVAAQFGDPALRERLQLTLYESAPRILAAFPERMASGSHAVLERLGFSVRTGTRVTAASASGLSIQGDADEHPTELTVWAAGVKAPAVMTQLDGLQSNPSRQLLIDERLQPLAETRIFALGDCASLKLPDRERPLPPTAQIAAQQSEHLARHLPAWLDGQPMPAFVPRERGSLVSLGKYNAYGTLGKAGLLGERFVRGGFAQLGHAMLYRSHQQALHGFGKATLLMLTEHLNRLVQPHVRLS